MAELEGGPLLWAPSRKPNNGSSDSFIFTRHCNFGFPFILVFTKFSLWKKKKKNSNPGKLEKAPGTALYSKGLKVLGTQNYQVAWKMAEGSRQNSKYVVQ